MTNEEIVDYLNTHVNQAIKDLLGHMEEDGDAVSGEINVLNGGNKNAIVVLSWWLIRNGIACAVTAGCPRAAMEDALSAMVREEYEKGRTP